MSAVLTRDPELIAKLDPYVVVKVGSQEQKTSVCSKGGKRPTWTQALTFHVESVKDVILLTVYDKKTLVKDTVIGTASFKLSDLLVEKRTTRWLNLMYNENKIAGEIYVELEVLEVGGAKGALHSKVELASPNDLSIPEGVRRIVNQHNKQSEDSNFMRRQTMPSQVSGDTRQFSFQSA